MSETPTTANTDAPKAPQTHGLSNILINVIVPVFILNKLSTHLGPSIALGLALAFPLCKGLFDLAKYRKVNYFSILGLINVSITGSLALLHLDGLWFAAKEAVFPSLIAVFVYASSYANDPFIKTLLLNPQLMHMELIQEKIEASGKQTDFDLVLRRATQYLAGTFLVSAAVNFSLALRIFTPIDTALDETARATVLNGQIASMTMWAAGVIIVPSILMLSAILWYMLRGIRAATGLSNEEILKG